MQVVVHTAPCHLETKSLRQGFESLAGKVLGVIDDSEPDCNYPADGVAKWLIGRYDAGMRRKITGGMRPHKPRNSARAAWALPTQRLFECIFVLGLNVAALGVACGQTASTGSGQAASTGSGHAYPIKPIRILTSEPGGGGDITLRMIGPYMTSALGQPIVIDNRPLAMSGEIVAKASPDGYTATVYGTTLWLGPLLQPMHYDPLRDFAPITMLSRSPNIVLVHPSLAVNSVKELIALARAKPGVLNYSSGNSGSSSHLAMELFKSMAGVDLVRIPYKGAGPAANALVSGEVQVMLATATSAAPHVKSGRAKALAVTTAQRSALMPELATVSETGLPGYESASVYGMVTTAKTPAVIINRLNVEVVRVLRRADINEKILISGAEVVLSTPEEFGAMIKSEMARMGKVIKNAGIRAN